jgi:hypothetical protein
MKTQKHLLLLASLSLSFLAAMPVRTLADDRPATIPTVLAVTGQSDWSLIQVDPNYITVGADGITIRRMPLAGQFALRGDGLALDATIKGILDADLDLAGTGSIYGPLVLTQNVKGHDVPVFKGRFFGRTDTWLASGLILLHGLGRFEGVTIALSFLETGPNDEVFTLTGHLFDRHND